MYVSVQEIQNLIENLKGTYGADATISVARFISLLNLLIQEEEKRMDLMAEEYFARQHQLEGRESQLQLKLYG
jgi:hypothetical protein